MARLLARLLLAGLALSSVVLLSTAVYKEWGARQALFEDPPVASEAFSLPGPAPVVEHRHTIARGDTLGTILQPFGVPTQAVLDAARPLYDLSKVRIGRELVLVEGDVPGDVVALRYPLGEDDTLVVERQDDAWTARVDAVAYAHRPVLRSFDVDSSLWQAAVDAGLRPADIVAIAHVFESDVDFNTEIHQGDRVELVFDELTRDDGFQKLGPPHAVRLHTGDKLLTAIRHQAPGAAKAEYWDDEGFNRKGAFLRSPLEFSRVTSGFSHGRYHPILKKKRPHNGVDFGAPTGTPVRAVAKGVVTRAGRAGGHGNMVKLDHDGPYETSYSHLSKIRVRQGEHVAQGQIIGEVGATGLATGPHLHYQLWVNGTYKDPLHTDLPRNERLPAAAMPDFKARRDLLVSVLDGAQAVDVLAPAPTAEEGPSEGDGSTGEPAAGDQGEPSDQGGTAG